MGREIRRVPPNWIHPMNEHGNEQPMFDVTIENAMADWLANFDRIRSGDLDDIERECYPNGLIDWLHDEGVIPDPKYYRPWKGEEATWFQLWENVTEGTPVTPPFPTLDKLSSYLAKNGTFWDDSGWGQEAAEAFCREGSAPSMVIVRTAESSTIIMSKDIPLAHERGTL